MNLSRALAVANLSLLLLYPLAWTAPLAHAGLLPWFSGREITVIGGVADLWGVDRGLAVLVALFAVVLPVAKTAALAAVHAEWLGGRALGVIEVIGRLSMADVFLVAVYIVMVKGVGLGHVTTGWGLWLFTFCVLAQIAIFFAMKKRTCPSFS